MVLLCMADLCTWLENICTHFATHFTYEMMQALISSVVKENTLETLYIEIRIYEKVFIQDFC